MKTLYYYIIAFSLVIVLLPSNAILAQNEIQPTMEFDHASYFTKKMTCNFYYTEKISAQDQEQTKATIIVTDPNANKFSTSIDRVTVFVWSDSDKKGIEITAYETEVNSGIFKGTVTISEGQSTQNTIHVSDGDTLSARYASTAPLSLGTTNHDIITTAFIGMSCPPLERVPASSIRILDNKGNDHNVIAVDQQVMITSNIVNPTPTNQNFTYIVQIQDKNGSTASLAWLSGTMLSKQAFSPSVSWTPSRVGNYVVNVFVWQSLTNPNALSPPLYADLTVLHSSSIYEKSIIGNVENLHCKLGFDLVIKPSNNSPACVTPSTAQKLVERGWAKNQIGVSTLAKPSIELYNVTTSLQPIILGMSFFINAEVVNNQNTPITYYGGCISPLSISFNNIQTHTDDIHCLAISKYVLGPHERVSIQSDKINSIYNGTGHDYANAELKFQYENNGTKISWFTSAEFPIQPAIKLNCSKPFQSQIEEINKSVNIQKAIALAHSSPEFLSKVKQYGTISYMSFYNDLFPDQSCNAYWKGIEVMFTVNDKNGVRNIQVSEDINLTKVIKIEDFQAFTN